MKTKIKYTVIVVAVLAILFGIAHLASNYTYSDSARSGVVTKFGKKGFPFKTWEGELHQGGIEQGGVAKTWEFSTTDPDVAERIDEAMGSGDHVKLPYHEKLFTFPWKSKTNYLVQDVVTSEAE